MLRETSYLITKHPSCGKIESNNKLLECERQQSGIVIYLTLIYQSRGWDLLLFVMKSAG